MIHILFSKSLSLLASQWQILHWRGETGGKQNKEKHGTKSRQDTVVAWTQDQGGGRENTWLLVGTRSSAPAQSGTVLEAGLWSLMGIGEGHEIIFFFLICCLVYPRNIAYWQFEIQNASILGHIYIYMSISTAIWPLYQFLSFSVSFL